MLPPSNRSRAGAAPYIALSAGLLLTAGSAAGLLKLAGERDEARFQNACEQVQDLLATRIALNEDSLLAARGLFDASGGQVSEASFRALVRALELDARLPGGQRIGFSQRLRPGEVAAVEAELRRSGHPGFRVWPAGPREEYHAVVMLEPPGARGHALLGYDMFTEPVRDEAMSRARDTGALAASGRVTLVQERGEPAEPGFLLYAPIYRGGGKPPDVESRREALLGFAFSPLRVGDLLEGIFGTQQQPRVQFDIYEAAWPDEAALLYRGITRPRGEVRHATTATVSVAGRPWMLSIVSTPTFEATSGRGLIPYLVGLALALNAALFFAVRGQARARGAALAAAERTAQLQSLTSALSAVVTTDEVAALVVGRIQEAAGASVASIHLLDPDGRTLRMRAERGVEESLARSVAVLPVDAPMPLPQAIRTRQPVWLPTWAAMVERFPEVAVTGPLRVVPREASASLPLISGGRVHGGLFLAFAAPQPFDAEERELLVAIATQCALALDRAALYEAERTARQRLATLTDIAQRFIEARLDLPSVLRAICVEVAQKLGDSCSINLVSDDGRTLALAEVAHRDPVAAAAVREVLSRHPVEVGGETALARVFRAGQPLLVPVVPGGGDRPDLPADYREHLQRHHVTSLMVVPLRAAGRTIGTVTASRGAGSPAYTEEDQRLLQDVADRAAYAVENARLVDRLRASREEARLLARVSAELSGSLDLEGTLARVAQVVVPSHADWCFADLATADGGFDRVAVAHSDPADAGLAASLRRHYGPGWQQPPLAGAMVAALAAGDAWSSGQLADEMIGGMTLDPRHREELRRMRLRSFIMVPLAARGRALGGLSFASRSRVYAEADVPFFREVAQRAALAIDNARLYEEARQAVRVRDEFLSVAGHELRTPLAALALQMDSAQRQAAQGHWGEVPQPVMDRMAKARGQVRRLEGLITELLDVSRIAIGRLGLQLEPVDLHEVVEEVTARFEEQLAREGCELRVRSAPGLVGRWDRMRLDQVLSNLLSNAAKYGAGRPIEVRAELGEDGRAALSVRDQGIGISPEDQARIFRRFERAVSERHYGGLGLGLWISRQIVEAMGGAIELDSQPGKGSTFTARLPLEPLPPAGLDQAASATRR